MGSFDRQYQNGSRERAGRSVLKSAVGDTAVNDPDDLRRVEATLRNIGALPPHVQSHLETRAILDALHSIEAQSETSANTAVAADRRIEPGSVTELAFRQALARGRFPLSHRAVAETVSHRGPRRLIGNGMLRAREKLNSAQSITPDGEEALKFRRAALPAVAPATLQTNGRLAAILTGDGDFSELIQAIVQRLTEGGRQGFADVRDLWNRLEGLDSENAKRQARRIEAGLGGLPLRRFRKLTLGQPPTEGDFRDSDPQSDKPN